jgi:integrase
MNRPRDRSSATGLLPRMEARPWKDSDKVTYRYHPVGGKPINLGTDREKALRAVLDMNGETAHHGSLLWCWEQYQTGRRFKRLAEGTRLDYGYAWKQIEKHMGSLPAASISPPMVARYVHITRADSPRRADLERSLLSMIFKHAIMLGVCERNPTVDVEPHGSTPSEVMPDELAMRRFLAWLDAASGHRKPRRAIGHMAEFASLVGARRVEFLDLTWAQVDLDAGVVRMPRAKQRGRAIFDNVAISPRLRALLDRLPRADGCPYLFTGRDGNPFNSGSFKSLWSRSMIDAIAEGVLTTQQRFTFHSLRRFYATMHRAKHGDLPDLHADKRITSRVYDATKEIGRKAL